MINTTELQDIITLLKEINKINQKKFRLTEAQKKLIEAFPVTDRRNQKKELLKPLKKSKKDLLRILTTELEKKVKKSDLPEDIVTKIFKVIKYIDESVKLNDLKQQIIILNELVKEAISQKQQNEGQKVSSLPIEENAQPLVIPFANEEPHEIAPFVHIRYTKEKFEQATRNYFQNKILTDLVMAAERPIVPIEPKREYPKKRGSQYPKAQIELEKKHTNVWEDLLVKETQKAMEKAKEPIQTKEEILTSFKNMPPMKQKVAITALKNSNKELLQQQEKEEKEVYEVQLQKNIERQRRKKAQKEAKRSKREAKLKGQTKNFPKNQKKTNIKKVLEKGAKKEQKNSPLLTRLKKGVNTPNQNEQKTM